MKVYVDTSFVVPLFVPSHMHHAAALAHYFSEFTPTLSLYSANHTVAETYTTLVKRLEMPLPPGDAAALIHQSFMRLISPKLKRPYHIYERSTWPPNSTSARPFFMIPSTASARMQLKRTRFGPSMSMISTACSPSH